MRFAHRQCCIGIVAAAMLAATPAYAGRTTYTVPVSVTVLSGCTVVALPLVFNIPVPINGNVDSATSIAVRCTPNTAFVLDIDNGLHANGVNRRVFNATANAFIKYDIFKDPPHSNVWGTGSAKNLSGNSGPTGLVTYPVYGRVSSSTNLKAGGYTDTLTVTINF
ncbi:MAG: spore coat protein U domain-containing protein [Sphingomonadales bacterium]|nr:spore coat protein U domain-containing protein [Sphingomonadales bacterium]